MFDDLQRALAQAGDPRFRAVLLRGLALTVALLLGLFGLVFWTVGWLVPDGITLPWIGTISWIDSLASWGALILMVALSPLLMVPVASVFTSLFLDEIAEAVEDRHYPNVPRSPRVPVTQALRDTLGFLGLLIGVNLLALVAYLLFAPFAPAIFIAVNGYLLGREYFQISAMRHLGREGAATLRRQHRLEIWMMGALMAVPLMVPLLNLCVPILGAASFTHLFHRLRASSGGRGQNHPR